MMFKGEEIIGNIEVTDDKTKIKNYGAHVEMKEEEKPLDAYIYDEEVLQDKVISVKRVKEAVGRRTNKLKEIDHLLSFSGTNEKDWDLALKKVRDLISDKDKIFGEGLCA